METVAERLNSLPNFLQGIRRNFLQDSLQDILLISQREKDVHGFQQKDRLISQQHQLNLLLSLPRDGMISV